MPALVQGWMGTKIMDSEEGTTFSGLLGCSSGELQIQCPALT